jgi:hypothetical protein
MTAHFPGLVQALSSIKSDGVQQVIWTQTSPDSEMMRSYKCFLIMSKMTPSQSEERYYKELYDLEHYRNRNRNTLLNQLRTLAGL